MSQRIRKILLVSIRPQHAHKLLAGEKTVELRRVAPNVQNGDMILIYSCSPERALVGTAYVARVLVSKPRDLWNQVRDKACVSKSEFDSYFAGASRAVGIFLRHVRALAKPVPLEELRRESPGFHPPQCFRYVHAEAHGTYSSLPHTAIRAALAG